MANHYDTIGVSPNADRDKVRRAYLKKARLLHPDRFASRPDDERQKAERKMQSLNAAWSVLSDPAKREAYDRELAGPVPRATGPVRGGADPNFRPFDESEPFKRPERTGPQVASEKDMEITGFARLMRVGPLAILLGTFLGIFILTAIIGSRDVNPVDSPGTSSVPAQPTGSPIQCINERPVVETVPCNGPKDALVWSVAPSGETCPPDLDSVYRPQLGGLYCVTRE